MEARLETACTALSAATASMVNADSWFSKKIASANNGTGASRALGQIAKTTYAAAPSEPFKLPSENTWRARAVPK